MAANFELHVGHFLKDLRSEATIVNRGLIGVDTVLMMRGSQSNLLTFCGSLRLDYSIHEMMTFRLRGDESRMII